MATKRRAWPTWGWNLGVMPHTYIRNTPSACNGTSSSSRPVSVEYIRTDMGLIMSERWLLDGDFVFAPEKSCRHGQDAFGSSQGTQAVRGGRLERYLRKRAGKGIC